MLLTSPLSLAFAEDPPVYPAENPNPETLSAYYQQLSKYYEDQSKLYADKAQEEEHKLIASKSSPAEVKNPRPFDGTNAGLGFAMNTGNTNTQNFNGTAFVNYSPNKASTTTWNTTYQNSHDNAKGQISDKFFTDLNSAYNFNFTSGIYGDANFTRNPFSGYNYQINESVGYNHVFFDTNTFSLTGQFGPGLQQNSVPSPGSFENQVTGNAKILSVVNLTNKTSWRETYAITAAHTNTNQTLDTMITTAIFDQFALQFDLLASYDTHPLGNAANWNTTTTLSIVYNF